MKREYKKHDKFIVEIDMVDVVECSSSPYHLKGLAWVDGVRVGALEPYHEPQPAVWRDGAVDMPECGIPFRVMFKNEYPDNMIRKFNDYHEYKANWNYSLWMYESEFPSIALPEPPFAPKVGDAVYYNRLDGNGGFPAIVVEVTEHDLHPYLVADESGVVYAARATQLETSHE